MKKIRLGLKNKLTLFLIVIIELPIVCISAAHYWHSQDNLLSTLREHLVDHATELTYRVPAEKVTAILEGGPESEEYLEMKHGLKQFLQIEGKNIAEAYILVPTRNADVMKFLVDGQPDESRAAGFLEEYDVSSYPEIKAAFLKASADNEVSADKWGVWLSGYAPVKNNAGVTIAIAGVDMSASQIARQRQEIVRMAVIYSLIGFLVALIIGRLSAKTISNTILTLINGVKTINEGTYGKEIAITRNDEIGDLVSIFNAMSKKLHELDKLKLDFLSIISHELYTPISPISTGIDILSELPDLKDPSKKVLAAMKREINKLHGLIDEVMDFSWLDASHTKLEKEAVSIVDVSDGAIEDVVSESTKKEVAVIKKYEANLPVIMADKKHLRHTLKILLDNAIKFSTQKSEVVISIKRTTAPGLEITVSDKGAGIASENISAVFNGFYQVEDPLTRTHGGLGIGLAIAKRFVTMHNGNITVTSKGLGYGSTFTILLPLS